METNQLTRIKTRKTGVHGPHLLGVVDVGNALLHQSLFEFILVGLLAMSLKIT